MDSPSAVAGVNEGDVIAGKYRIDKVLGAGGMGVVVAARHIGLDERVAIKFLLPEALVNREVVARFEREARAAVKIKSEHVVHVTDVGTLESGAPYMVMEYLDGSDLSAWIQQRGPMPVEQAIEFVLQACEAIADAHGLGIIHRDLKPANLFCLRRSDGLLSIKVLDFGISKVTHFGGSAPEMSMTKTASVMGSPLYMSPEQMASAKDVDPRTDIWAIGIILHELLAGRTPFSGDTLPEVCVKIATKPPEPLRAFRPDVPPELEAVIGRCLEKDRERRYPNVAELAMALVAFGPKRARASAERAARVISAAGLSVSAVGLPPSSDQMGAPTAAGTMASWGHTADPQPGKGKGLVIGVAAVLAVVVIVGGVLLARRLVSGPSAATVGPTGLVASIAPTAAPIVPASVSAPAAIPPPVVEPAPTVAATPQATVAAAKKGAPGRPQASPPATATGAKPQPAPVAPSAAPPVPAPAAAPGQPGSDWGGRL